MLRPFALASLVAIGAAGAALAQPQGGIRQDPYQMFQLMDRDGDGRVTELELSEFRTRRFAEFDANSDAVIDRGEFIVGVQAQAGQRAERRFDGMDTDGDGRLTDEEWGVRATRRFARLDTDGDGAVTLDEVGLGRRGR